MKRLVLSLAALMAACTASGDTSTGSARLVFADGDGGISIWSSDGGATRVGDPVDDSQLAQPIWSPSGASVSWAVLRPDSSEYVVHHLESGEESVVETPTFPFYAYWSPDDQHLVLLRNGPNSVAVELVDLATETSALVDADAPYYLSWNPDAGSFVAHVGESELVVLDVDGGRETLASTSAGYLAPFWTADGVFHVSGDNLVLESSGAATPLLRLSAPTQFVVNHDGSAVALQQLSNAPSEAIATQETPSASANQLIVFDVAAGEVSIAHDDPVIGFSWSPDGQSLLYHSVGEAGLVANVWSGGESASYTTYIPSEAFGRDLFPFFPQYAQSMSMWSPDSTSFLIVGEVDDRSGVWVQDLSKSEPTFVAEGSWAAWSP